MEREATALTPSGADLEVTSEDVLQDWLGYMESLVAAGELAQATAGAYARGMQSFVTWCREDGIDQVAAAEIRRWKADMLETACCQQASIRALPAYGPSTDGPRRSEACWAIRRRGLEGRAGGDRVVRTSASPCRTKRCCACSSSRIPKQRWASAIVPCST